MTETTERKNKYIGFRIAFNDYLKIAELCNKKNITITDFVLANIYPALEKNCLIPAKKENNNVPPILKENTVEKNINATIEALLAKEKIINQKLNQLN